MSDRGRGWKRSRWGGQIGRSGGWGNNGRWRTNYRGQVRGLGSWDSSWGKRTRWRTNYRGWLGQGDGGSRSVWEGAGDRFSRSSYGGGGLRTSMHGSMDPGMGMSSSLSEQGYIPRNNGSGGILSSFEPGFGGGKSKPKKVRISLLDPEVRERYEARVSVMLSRYGRVFYDATGDDLQPVIDGLLDLLGPKWGRLALDWVHQQGHVPSADEVARFVVWIVEAAAVDGGQEPFLWKVQRAISALLQRLEVEVKKRFRARTKLGPRLPGLEPADGTPAARRQDISGLGESMVSGRSKLARFVRRLFHRSDKRRLREMRPEAPPNEYQADVR